MSWNFPFSSFRKTDCNIFVYSLCIFYSYLLFIDISIISSVLYLALCDHYVLKCHKPTEPKAVVFFCLKTACIQTLSSYISWLYQWHSLYLVSLTEWLPLINWAEIINHVLKHNFRLLSYFHLCYSNIYDSSNNMYTPTLQCLHKPTIKNNCMNWQRALDYKPRILQWIILNLYNH